MPANDAPALRPGHFQDRMTNRRNKPLREQFAVLVAMVVAGWCFAWVIGIPKRISPLAPLDLVRAACRKIQGLQSMVEPNAEVVRKIADDIRTIEPSKERQVYLLDVIPATVQYYEDRDTWGEITHFATPSESEALRMANGWPVIRGDCKTQAFLVASVAAQLGIPYRIKDGWLHVWTEVRASEEGWMAVNRLGRHSDAAIDAEQVGGWSAHTSIEAKRDFARRMNDKSLGVRAAFDRLFQPPPDPNAQIRIRAVEKRNTGVRLFFLPSVVGLMVGLACGEVYLAAVRRWWPAPHTRPVSPGVVS